MSPRAEGPPDEEEPGDLLLRITRATGLLLRRTREAEERKESGVTMPEDDEEDVLGEELGIARPLWNPPGEDGPHGKG